MWFAVRCLNVWKCKSSSSDVNCLLYTFKTQQTHLTTGSFQRSSSSKVIVKFVRDDKGNKFNALVLLGSCWFHCLVYNNFSKSAIIIITYYCYRSTLVPFCSVHIWNIKMSRHG